MTAPSISPEYGDFIYVHHVVGNPYGNSGATTGVEYTVDIENLIAGGYMTIAPGSVSDPYTVPLGSYGTDPLNPAPGEWVYVYNNVGTPYGNAGTVVGVEYTTHIHRLIADGAMQLTLPPTSQYENFPLYGDNSFASLGMVKDLMYAYYGGYDGGDGDYSHLIISQRLRDAIVEEMGIAYDPTVQALLDDAEAYNASTLAARDLTLTYRDTASTHATTATTQAGIATTKAGEAATSAANALSYRNTASTHATTATTQAGIATTQAGIAADEADDAAASAADALAYRNTASTHATTATTQAGIATTKAGEASTSAANALAYRNAANTAAQDAAAARDVALANSLTWRGPWAAGTSYIARDAVSYNGSSWRALAPSTGVTPVEGATWTVLAAKGDMGTTAWGDLTGKPSTFPPDAHTHPVTDMTATGTRSSSTYLRGDNTWATPTNTTYSVMSEAEATTGTATTARTVSAAGLKGTVQRWATGSYTTAVSAIGQSLASAANAAAARAAISAAELDVSGKVPLSQLPAEAMTDFLGTVASQAAMLALVGQRGDWCTRTDLGTDWQLVAEPSSSLASWREKVYPASPVQSVAGKIGAVTLVKADVGLSNVDNTSDANKPISTATSTALAGKANTSHTHVATTDLTATGTKNSTTFLRGDNTWATPTDTTYSVPTQAEAEAGTATTGRAFSAQRVAQAAIAASGKKDWQGTQAQYDALPTKDADRTYWIV